MKKHRLTAAVTACMMLAVLCGCAESKGSVSETAPVSQEIVTAPQGSAEYSDGTYSGEGFSLYADPSIWKYSGGEGTCDLLLNTNNDINSFGISIYVSDDDHGGKSAQDIVMNNNDERIIYTGALATTALTFYYYEWAISDALHGRTYFADYGDKYLCVYAESTNFGYVENKIADLLGSLELSENSK
ncbi:MAG: hypothetical protein IJK30_11715 [Ruminococcus sp.]|nr:hypothetical protein [Ruminococcus sp.]